MDITALMKLGAAWNTFKSNHPKFPDFLAAVKNKGLAEGMTIDIVVNYPDGTSLRSGIRLRQSDLDLLGTLSELGKQQ